MNLNLTFLKIIIILNIFIYSLLKECSKDKPILKNNICTSDYCTETEFQSGKCIIANSIAKIQWLNNIIKFENTNGDILLSISKDLTKLVFSTTLSNNVERIYYYVENLDTFIFNNGDNIYKPYIKKEIGDQENKGMENIELSLIYNNNYRYIILAGGENSTVEILNLDLYKDGYDIISKNDFLQNKIAIKGANSFSFFFSPYYIYTTITLDPDDISNYYLSLFLYNIIFKQTNIELSYINNYNITDVKGKYTSIETGVSNDFVSCFYLNKENNYAIKILKIEDKSYFSEMDEFIIESELPEDEFYFIKGMVMDKKFLIYAYYSGESNEIPTLLFKQINNLYQFGADRFPNVYLSDYSFNNNIKYNDLVKIGINDFYFISTTKDKEILIIASLLIYKVSSNEYLSIRYFTIKLKQYYNMKILHGLKSIFFNNALLTLALDYCLYEYCGNSDDKIGNSALIFFSYLNKTNPIVKIDFIDYALNNNTDYIIVDLGENVKIENNIFNYSCIVLNLLADFYIGINYSLVETGEILVEMAYTSLDESHINISFYDYSLDKNYIEFGYNYYCFKTSDVNEYNNSTDKINTTYGESNTSASYSKGIFFSPFYYYYINISMDLSFECNNTNCSLCLRNDTDYCLVCKDEYYIIYEQNYIYGKKKVCQKKIDSEELSFDDLLNGKYKDINFSDEQIKVLYKIIKEYLENNYDGNEFIIYSGNVKVQIASIDSVSNSKELSDIALGECGEILKDNYCKNEDDSLIMLKFDITPENEKSTYVQYEIFEQNSKLFLELEECYGTNLIINIPIDLDSEIELLYDMLSESGYNLFDANDSFYNDICAVYTTQNSTDILLYDRRMDIYQLTVNISLCQEGCNFISYNSKTKKAKCDCPIKFDEIITNSSELEFNKNKMLDIFYEVLKNSNFRVLKCYKLTFNSKVFLRNIGSITLSILLLLFFILIIFFLNNSKQIKSFIQTIIENKYLEQENRQSNINSKSLINELKNNNLNRNKKDIKQKKFAFEKENKSKLINFSRAKTKKKKITKKKNHFITGIDNNIEAGNSELKNIDNIIIYKRNINHTEIKEPPKRKINMQKEEIKIDSDNKNIIRNMTNYNNDDNSSTNRYNINTNLLKYIPLDLNDNKPYIENTKDNIKMDDNLNDNNDIKIYTKINLSSSLKESIKKNNKKERKSSFQKKGQKLNKNIRFSNQMKEGKNEAENKYNNLEKKNLEKINIQNKEIINPKVTKLNDQEMNNLEYEKAIELDKRTYFQYYMSLLRKKQLIIFTFFPSDDYNITQIKIVLFIVSFCLYFTIDAFFFDDNSIHEVYENNGFYNILYQLPNILYSSIIPIIINMILKSLSLSEKDLLEIKKEKEIKKAIDQSKKIERCIYIKFFIFFILASLLMLFFWYFISCFCAVFNNTQLVLFKETLISFGISMLYPFGLNLIPGLLRIPALTSEKKDKKCLYKISLYIALI